MSRIARRSHATVLAAVLVSPAWAGGAGAGQAAAPADQPAPAQRRHPAQRSPTEPDFPTGPAVGERLPDFRLPNQRGEMVDFHVDRAGRKAAVLFQRSAVW